MRHTLMGDRVPDWSLRRPKPIWQRIYDFAACPLRFVVLPDTVCERLHLTSLRAERFAQVLNEMQGRCLDIGAGDNALIRSYRDRCGDAEAKGDGAARSIGVDVTAWNDEVTVIETSAKLPFDDASFDTVTLVACLNHIPERQDSLREAYRVLRPGGRIVLTMIERTLGAVGHRLWWYSEEKERDVDPHEEMGLDRKEMIGLLEAAGYRDIGVRSFCYGLNFVFVATRP